MPSIYDFCAHDLSGNLIEFRQFQGKVLLIVNTASQCGFTPQFDGLQALHAKYHSEGLVIIGFPCNQFGQQEPLDGSQIGAFCQKNYGVEFLMMNKIEVNGDNSHPLFQFLKSERGGILGDAIKWNFTKFLIGRDGKVIDRYAPTTKPSQLKKDILNALNT